SERRCDLSETRSGLLETRLGLSDKRSAVSEAEPDLLETESKAGIANPTGFGGSSPRSLSRTRSGDTVSAAGLRGRGVKLARAKFECGGWVDLAGLTDIKASGASANDSGSRASLPTA